MRYWLALALVVMGGVASYVSPVAAGEVPRYDQALHERWQRTLENTLQQLKSLRREFKRKYRGRLKTEYGKDVPPEEFLDKANSAIKEVNYWADRIGVDFEKWEKNADTTSRDRFRAGVAKAYVYSLGYLWNVLLEETGYDVDLLEWDFEHNAIFKEYERKQDEARRQYEADESPAARDKYEAVLQALKKEYGAKEADLRKRTVSRYEALTQRLVGHRRRLCGEAWDWANFFQRWKRPDDVEEVVAGIYKLFLADTKHVDPALLKRYGDTSALHYFYAFPFSADRLILGSGVILENQQSLYKMDKALLAEKVEDFGSLEKGSTIAWYSVGSLRFDNLTWWTNRQELQDQIMAMEEKLRVQRERRSALKGDVKRISREYSQHKMAWSRARRIIEKSTETLNRLSRSVPRRLKPHRDTVAWAQHLIDLIDRRIANGYSNPKERERDLAERARLEQSMALSQKILDKYRSSDKGTLARIDALQKSIEQARDTMVTERLLTARTKRDLEYAIRMLEEKDRLVTSMENTLKPLYLQKARMDAVKGDMNAAGHVVDEVTIYASDRMIYHAVHWDPRDALRQLDSELEEARRTLQEARALRASINDSFVRSIESVRAELAWVARAIMISAVGQATAEAIDFTKDVIDAAKYGGPPAALVEALYKTMNGPPFKLQDESAIAREVERDINEGYRHSLRSSRVPDYVSERLKEDLVDNFAIKGQAYKTRLSTYVQEVLVKKKTLSLDRYIAKQAGSAGFVEGLEKRAKALLQANTQLENLRKGRPYSFETVTELGKNLISDTVKNMFKASFQNIEHRAWYNYFKADIESRKQFSLWQMAQRHYWHSFDRYRSVLDARDSLLRGYDPKAGFRVLLNNRFTEGESLRIVLASRGGVKQRCMLGGVEGREVDDGTYVLDAYDVKADTQGRVALEVGALR